MKIRVIPLLTVCSSFAISSLTAGPIETAAPATPPAANALPAGAAPQFSGGIPDVVKLAKSGVDESVVVAYIKNSSGPFQPNADEIIRLRGIGLTSQEISTMLERGAELRTQAAPAYNYAAPPMPTTTAPPVVTTPPLTYADSGYDTQPSSTVVYVGGNYSGYGGYPYYYGGYPYYYPYFYPGFGFGFGFGDFDRFHHGGFRGGFHGGGFGGGFRAGGGFRGGGGGFHGGSGGGHR